LGTRYRLHFFKNTLNDRLVIDGLKINKHGSHHLYATGPRFVGSSKILLFYKFQPVVELSRDLDKSGNNQNTHSSHSVLIQFSFPLLLPILVLSFAFISLPINRNCAQQLHSKPLLLHNPKH
jgi:hypothetical protein